MGNVTSNVAAKFAFFPPDPPTYDVLEEEEGRLVVPGVTGDKNMDVHTLDTKAGNKVVAMFWKHPFARFTLLYSHGNAADLGQMHELFIELGAHLRVNIMWLETLAFVLMFCFLMKFKGIVDLNQHEEEVQKPKGMQKLKVAELAEEEERWS
ncbi:unnamed protein product [Linum trigynum]|uniref:Uncharacterized protein n=1 Tax=Linum trigynum TaxID=586398 RepID=A0AAV2GK84_9ROSI